jgi:C4-dicarboxylate transporter, DctM subunit
LTTPLVLPLVSEAGWDIVWVGVVVVAAMEIAAVTPPVGLNLYAVKSAARDIPLKTIYVGAIPFWTMNLLVIGLLYMFPQIALFLPGYM